MLSGDRKRVTLVVDSEPARGRGHLSRSLLLADALAAHGAACEFALTAPVDMPGLHAYPTRTMGFEHAVESDIESDIVVVDGYDFSDATLARWRAATGRLVVIDDLAERAFRVDVILNHNIYAESLRYDVEAGTTLLLGPRFGLVRAAFFDVRDCPKPRVPRALVTLGSGPAAINGIRMATRIHSLLGLEVDVAVGAVGTVSEAPAEGIHLHRWGDLPSLAASASMVICGLGVTFMEMLAAGRDAIGVQVAGNQRLAFESARAAGYRVLDHADPDMVVQAVATTLQGGIAVGAPIAMIPGGPARAASAILEKEA